MRRLLLRATFLLGGTLALVATSFAAGIQTTTEYANAQSFLNKGDYESAAGALQPLTGVAQHAAQANLEIGRIRQRQAEAEYSLAIGHYTAAAQALRAAANGNLPGTEAPKVLYDLGRIYDERLNDPTHAMEAYGLIIQKYPTFLAIDKVVFYQAQALEKAGRRDEAAQFYQRVVSQYPYSSFHPVAQERMKTLAPGTSVAAAAIETQKEVVETARDDETTLQAQMDLAKMHRENGEYKEAVKALRKVAGNSTNQDLGRKAMGELAQLLDEKEKDYQGAANVLDDMVKKYPNDEDTNKNLLKLGKLYEDNLKTEQKYVRDGRVYKRDSIESVTKAVDYYEQVTSKSPDADEAADAYLRKGELYQSKLNDPDKARAEYENFLRHFPSHAEADKVKEKLKALGD